MPRSQEKHSALIFFFLFGLGFTAFQEYFTYIEPIVHQRLMKTSLKTTWPSIILPWIEFNTITARLAICFTDMW